jgi:hypothetical protein
MGIMRRLCALTSLSLMLAACERQAPTELRDEATQPAVTRTLEVGLSRGLSARKDPSATVRLDEQQSIEVKTGGHTVRFVGDLAIVDGRTRVKLAPQLARFIEQGRAEMAFQASPEGRRLAAAAERALGRSAAVRGASSDLRMSASMAGDACVELGLALYSLNQHINNFWQNTLADLAWDVATDVIASFVTGSPQVGIVLLVADVGTALVEYEILKIQREGIAGDMRAAGCV